MMRVAILGATGAVGRTMIETLAASSIPVDTLRLLATPRSAGARLVFRGRTIAVDAVSPDSFDGIDLALFSAGASASETWAPIARRAGAWVIDNSSRFRMDTDVPLIVPEVNAHRIPDLPALIANPNCSTIQLVVALAPLAARFGLQRVVVSTYQSASGVGGKGIVALDRELHEESEQLRDTDQMGRPSVTSSEPHGIMSGACSESASSLGSEPPSATPRTNGSADDHFRFQHPLAGNVIPQCDIFLDDGYTREEEKMLRETRKILEAPDLPVHPTCVRVPVRVAHSESVFVQLGSPVDLAAVREVLSNAPGIRLLDDPATQQYPTALAAAGTDPVWVGRLRRDRIDPLGLYFWVVADNLRKGAALNAVQIAERVVQRTLARAGSGREQR